MFDWMGFWRQGKAAQLFFTFCHFALFLTLLFVTPSWNLRDVSTGVGYKERPGRACLAMGDEDRKTCYREGVGKWRDDEPLTSFILVNPITLLLFSEWMQVAFVVIVLLKEYSTTPLILMLLNLAVQVVIASTISLVGTDVAANIGQVLFLIVIFLYAFWCQYWVLYLLKDDKKPTTNVKAAPRLSGVIVLGASGHLIRLPLSVPSRRGYYTRLGDNGDGDTPKLEAEAEPEEDIKYVLLHWIRESVTVPLYLTALLLCVMPWAPCWAVVGVFLSAFFAFSCKAAVVLLEVQDWKEWYRAYTFSSCLVSSVLGCVLLGYITDVTDVFLHSARATIFAPVCLVSVFLILAFVYQFAPVKPADEDDRWWRHVSAGVVAAISFAVVNLVLVIVLWVEA